MLETSNYRIKQYSDTPLDDFLNEFSHDREEFSTPVVQDTPPAENKTGDIVTNPDTPCTPEQPLVPEKKTLTEAEIKGKRQFTSNFLAKNTDRAMAFLLAMIADTDDVDEWKAEEEDLRDMKECYFEMMQTYGWGGMPPWVNLLMCILFTYGPMVREAMKVRGINKKLSEKAAQQEVDKLILEQKLAVAEKKLAENSETTKESEKTVEANV
jgi:hypothetical protein